MGRRILDRIRRNGIRRAFDEAAYYALYALLLRSREESRIRRLTAELEALVRAEIDAIPQVRPTDVPDPDLCKRLNALGLDAIFATCTDVYFPQELLESARLGAFLWHEGITPEYRGVYSAFWALYREDYSRIGYTLLKMNDRLDAGPVFVQGRAVGADFRRDWHCYLGVKSVLDSLPHVDSFLRDLEAERHCPIVRPAQDGYHSYPTATALIRIAIRRRFRWPLRVAGPT